MKRYSNLIDCMLDSIREPKLHPILDVLLSVVLMVVCIIYYYVLWFSCETPPSKNRNNSIRNLTDLWNTLYRWVNGTTCASSCPPNSVLWQVPLVTIARRSSFVQDCSSSPSPTSSDRDVRKCMEQFYVEYNRVLANHAKSSHMTRQQCDDTVLGSDLELIDTIRSDLPLRRIATLFMAITTSTDTFPSDQIISSNLQQHNDVTCDDPIQKIKIHVLRKRLESVWIDLLRLPSINDPPPIPSDTPSQLKSSQSDDTSQNHSNTFKSSLISYEYDISLILPAYNETGISVARVLDHAFKLCDYPWTVQVIVVPVITTSDISNHTNKHMDRIDELSLYLHEHYRTYFFKSTTSRSDTVTPKSNSNTHTSNPDTDVYESSLTKNYKYDEKERRWGEMKIVPYFGNGGRGPCLNFGAASGTGKILTFLHSDTILPVNWDIKIRNALLTKAATSLSTRTCSYIDKSTTTSTNNDNNSHDTPSIYHACTFRYGIDTSSAGLSNGGSNSFGDSTTFSSYPWGVHCVTVLGRLRAWLCRLPYGDHVISMPTSYFWYIGGYPNQPIMEDYALMDLLRKRSAAIACWHNSSNNRTVATVTIPNERLFIIPGPPVLCSPRRWQKLGVAYTTAVNAVLVHRYEHCQWGPDEIYNYYYNRRPNQRTSQS